MDYLYLTAMLTAIFTFGVSMATGAFFSRPAGTALGGAGVVASVLTIGAAIALDAPWWGYVPPGLLLLFNGFLAAAALGGEK